MNNREAVMCLSGGMDSTTLLYFAHREMGLARVHCVSFIYGQRHDKEIAMAQYHANMFGDPFYEFAVPALKFAGGRISALVSQVIDVPKLDDVLGDPQPPTYVPFRNMVFLSQCLSIAEGVAADVVLYGAQRHDLYGYWDTTPEFVNAMNAVARLGRKWVVRIEAPFVEHSKAQVLEWGLKNGVDYSMTWSCYQGGELACGTCPTCKERLAAFAKNNVDDPIRYEG